MISLTLVLLPVQYSFSMWIDVIIIASFYLFVLYLLKNRKIHLSELGLGKSQLRKSVLPALLISVSIAVAFFLIFMVDSEIFQDERFNKSFAETIIYALIIIPLATAIFEELLFRGLLLSWLQKSLSFRKSQVFSSTLFGLWHVIPSIGVQTTLISEDLKAFEQIIIISAIVLATFFAGMILCELKNRFNSLYIPIAAHWTINGLGIIFAYLAWNTY